MEEFLTKFLRPEFYWSLLRWEIWPFSLFLARKRGRSRDPYLLSRLEVSTSIAQSAAVMDGTHPIAEFAGI